MRYLYKYPQAAFPYADSVAENRRRDRGQPEYELLDTGVLAGDRYFDVLVEYAKASTDDILITITAANRGPEPADLDLLPTLWFRNTWSWTPGTGRPQLRARDAAGGHAAVTAEHPSLGRRWLLCEGLPELLVTENETNFRRLWGVANQSPYVKDGIGEFVVDGARDAVNPYGVGTKAAARYHVRLAPGESL